MAENTNKKEVKEEAKKEIKKAEIKTENKANEVKEEVSEKAEVVAEKAKEGASTFVDKTKKIFNVQKKVIGGLDKTSKLVLLINVLVIALIIFIIGVKMGEERAEKKFRDDVLDSFEDLDNSSLQDLYDNYLRR